MALVEVLILDYTIVLPCGEDATVADITAAALKEYIGFNLKSTPQKILFTRDAKGRVLSGGLKIVANGLNDVLEVVTTDFDEKDCYTPTKTEELYRNWQIWTAEQIKDTVYKLSVEDVPSRPELETLRLLHELCTSPSAAVQTVCVKVLKLLMTKFSQRDVVIDSAEAISKLCSSTKHASVVIDALESFQGLSPLQAKVFRGSKYLREMFNVQKTLVRFTAQEQGQIFEAFERVSTIIGDHELLGINAGKGSADEEYEDDDAADVVRTSALQAAAVPGAEGEVEISLLRNKPAASEGQNTIAVAGSKKKINLKRLESLLSSDDRKIRLYALEKLRKLLSTAVAAWMRVEQQEKINKKLQLKHEQRRLQKKQQQLTGDQHQEQTAQQPSLGSLLVPASSVQVSRKSAYELQHPLGNSDGKEPAAADADVPLATQPQSQEQQRQQVEETTAIPGAPYLFDFTSAKEVESIVKCLFTCLKRCINARKKVNEDEAINKDTASGVATGKGAVAAAAAAAAGGKVQIHAKSTAGRLIQTALSSPHSDHAAAALAVDCLWLVAHFPRDVGWEALAPPLPIRRRLRVLGGGLLSNIQLIFATASREWYRLLLTLAHADEYNEPLQCHADMAEKCAYFFSLVVLHGMPRGWMDSQLQLEAPALGHFLAPPRPNFRSYIGLSYLSYLSSRAAQRSSGSTTASTSSGALISGSGSGRERAGGVGGVGGIGGVPSSREGDSLESLALQQLLSARNFEMTRQLWRWGTTTDRTRRKSCVLALTCLSYCSIFSHINEFLHKLDPITRLAAMLRLAVRVAQEEQREFAIQGPVFGEGAGASFLSSSNGAGDDNSVDGYDVSDIAGDDEANSASSLRLLVLDEEKLEKRRREKRELKKKNREERERQALLQGFVDGIGTGDEEEEEGDDEDELYDEEQEAEEAAFYSEMSRGAAAGGVEETKLKSLMNRHVTAFSSQAAATAMDNAAEYKSVLQKLRSQPQYVYPDIPLIRALLKTMWNLLNSAGNQQALHQQKHYDVDMYRRQMAAWLKEAEVGPAPNPSLPSHETAGDRHNEEGGLVGGSDNGDGASSSVFHQQGRLLQETNSNSRTSIFSYDSDQVGGLNAAAAVVDAEQARRGVKLSRVARKDDIINFYYNLLTQLPGELEEEEDLSQNRQPVERTIDDYFQQS